MFRESSACNRESWEVPKHFLRSEVLQTPLQAGWREGFCGNVSLGSLNHREWICIPPVPFFLECRLWNLCLKLCAFFPSISSVVWMNTRSKPWVSPVWKRQGAVSADSEKASIRNLGWIRWIAPFQTKSALETLIQGFLLELATIINSKHSQ